MIEKMKFLSITGPMGDIDRVAEVYLSRYEIQLENALSELKTVKNLRPFIENNPYKEDEQRARALTEQYQELLPQAGEEMDLEKALETVRGLDQELDQMMARKEELEQKRKELQDSRDQVWPFAGLDYDINRLFRFQHIKFRFGRFAKEYYDKFQAYVYDTVDAIQFKCRETKDYVWVVYCVPLRKEDKIDAIYSSMHFERMFLPNEYEGTPDEAGHTLEEQIQSLDKQIEQLEQSVRQTVQEKGAALVGAAQRLKRYCVNFDVRKMAACTKRDDHTFYILCGWMPKDEADRFRKEIENDAQTFCVVEDNSNNIMSSPPTKIKNPGLFKPFEMYVEMYGLPSYQEIDPTILVGLTYSVLFGFMFGDAGQGLCLLLGGLLLYKLKKMRLAGIISCCGFFSTIFGFLFGSIFGFEDIIEPLWLRPAEAMTSLPFIGKLNTVFVVAIGIGMGIILLCMVLNIINSLREKDVEKTWFDTNGAAGLVFYGALAGTIILYMSGNPLPATALLVVLFIIPLILMFFKEPLTAMVEKKKETMTTGVGMFITQGIFELFEVLLSYFSNTLSFIRVGAFAVSHAAMMEVVLMLAGAEAGSPNWAVIVGGNLFVCGMEGLIVGIQVLRLEYYELFSRFYRGSGREFKPYGQTAKES
ncbi:MAG TPA: ATPase [Candidatus Enterocloster faecavium]|uniref:ATPase n=1 Tax=Candidatus Enterocloster faecavium TaxID=2838560 RepID=A0A9D2L6M8_9FIRM|nr:ATPase [Candidatus Enterocloster faecavium]